MHRMGGGEQPTPFARNCVPQQVVLMTRQPYEDIRVGVRPKLSTEKACTKAAMQFGHTKGSSKQVSIFGIGTMGMVAWWCLGFSRCSTVPSLGFGLKSKVRGDVR